MVTRRPAPRNCVAVAATNQHVPTATKNSTHREAVAAIVELRLALEFGCPASEPVELCRQFRLALSVDDSRVQHVAE